MMSAPRLACQSLVAVALCLGAVPIATAQPADGYTAARNRMVNQVIVDAGVKNRRVIDAMRDTPRHLFVPLRERPKAYFDMSLPIGEKQTISSPFIVAYMTEALDPQPDEKVLEIGTGSGYQAAVLSPLVKDVYSIEIVAPLGRQAQRTLQRLDYENVHVKVGDGYQGWPEHAPFDKIIVTCSPEKVPRALFEQLREGGMMVIPVGERYTQTLYRLKKRDGKLVPEPLRPTLFVPMTGKAEDGREVQPNPKNPQLANGDFERPTEFADNDQENMHVPGWYYGRQVQVLDDSSGTSGKRHIRIRNETPGRAGRLLQGFPIDGRAVKRLEVKFALRHAEVVPASKTQVALLAIDFFDENRAKVGQVWVGPWHGDADWHRVERVFQVPAQAREGVLRLGLFGATGEIAFDEVSVQAK